MVHYNTVLQYFSTRRMRNHITFYSTQTLCVDYSMAWAEHIHIAQTFYNWSHITSHRVLKLYTAPPFFFLIFENNAICMQYSWLVVICRVLLFKKENFSFFRRSGSNCRHNVNDNAITFAPYNSVAQFTLYFIR